jgi:hypothetical protein
MRFSDSEIQSTGAFLVGELEKLDPELYQPIADFTWSRDIDLRTDVTIADEVSSFILSTFAGGFSGTGVGKKSWISGTDSTPAQVGVSATKVSAPITPWGMEVSYSVFELQKAMAVGRPIDIQKYDSMRMKHNLDIDQQVYLGDTEIGVTGLLNNPDVATGNVGAYVPGTTTPEQVVAMFNAVLEAAWAATQYARIPNRILVPPTLFAALISTQLPHTDKNLLNFVLENSLTRANGGFLEIYPCKYLTGAMEKIVAYTKARDCVRFPLVQLQSLPVQFRDYMQIVPYYGALGAVEFVRPEMVYYGILA